MYSLNNNSSLNVIISSSIFKLFSFRLHLLHCQIPCYCYRPFVCYIPFHLKLLLLLPVKQINTKFNVRCTYTHMHRLFLYTVKCLAIVIVRLSSIGFQILSRTKYVPSLVKIHWRMLILECSQGYYGRVDGRKEGRTVSLLYPFATSHLKLLNILTWMSVVHILMHV
jgi:hypothetical protein